MSTLSITNARIIDPASGYDDHGTIIIEDGYISTFGPRVIADGKTLDAKGLICAPGLIDMRVSTGEPGRENRETIATAARAAAAGGVTSIVIMPETNPVIDDMSLVDFITRRAENAPVNVYAAGALTKNLDGKTLTEIGLMSQAGAVMFSNGTHPIADAQTMRRLLSYSASFNALIANRAIDPSLSKDAVAHESDLSSRLGLTGAPVAAERIMAERDVALAELTGGRLLIDMISSADALEVVRRAKSRDLEVSCSVSINRLALLGGINDGTIDVIVSSHDPRPAGEKRLPYAEASTGAVGLEILLSAALSQVADEKLDLMSALAAMTCNPASLLGLESGQIKEGAPADLVLIDPNAPWVCNSDDLLSRSKNTPFDGRRLTGRAVITICGGQVVFEG